MLLTGYFGGYSQESFDFARRETQVALGMASAAEESGRPLVVLRPDNAAAKVMRDLAAQLTVLAPAGR